jgi:hypothetical protein
MSTAAAPTTVPQTRLPQLSGGWVSAYSAVWCLLALAATGLLAASVIHPSVHPAILTLRMLKGAILICVSGILLRRRRNDPVAALLSLAFLTWTITSSFDFASANALPMLLDRLRFLLFALALLLFPDGKWQPTWTRHLAAASAGTFLLGVAESIAVSSTRLFLPLAIACVVAAVIALVLRFRTAESEAARQQLKWVALGLVAGIGLILCAWAGAALNANSRTLPLMPILWEAMFQIGIVILALGFLISLLRYRLFDAETAISRSAAFAALTVAIVAVFAGTEATIENLGQAYLGMGIGNISAAMAAAIAAVLLNPLHNRIGGWAEQRFQRDLALLKRTLPDLLANQSPKVGSRQLGDVTLRMISDAIHATRSALLVEGHVIAAQGIELNDARRWARDFLGRDGTLLERYPPECVFRLSIPMRGTLGGATPWLLLGPRPDGTLYGKDELDALNVVLPAVRDSLNSLLMREAYLADRRRADHRVRREIMELRSRLTVIESAALLRSSH